MEHVTEHTTKHMTEHVAKAKSTRPKKEAAAEWENGSESPKSQDLEN